ncbi:hypothetical protein ACQJBY_011503 [Aegilops geniculata]
MSKNAWNRTADNAETRNRLQQDRALLNDLTPTQQRLRQRRANAPNITTKVLGGFVRTYAFNELSNDNVRDGTMTIEYDDERFDTHPITVLILENADNTSETGDCIVAHTENLSRYGGDLIVRPYFSTFAIKIQQYIVAYEPFRPNYIQAIHREPFFSADGRLSESWRNRMRSFIQLLHYAAKCKITHGSLSDPTSYVTCREDLKIISVGRRDRGNYVVGKDMEDLMALISTQFPLSLTNDEWGTLKKLLLSQTMRDPVRVHAYHTYYCRDWLAAALRHPTLLGTTEEILECFVHLHSDAMGLDDITGEKARFSNRIYKDYQQFRSYFRRDVTDDAVDNEYDFRTNGVVPFDGVYKALFTFTHSSYMVLKEDRRYPETMNKFVYNNRDSHWSPNYGSRFIYINVLRLVQNLIKHGVQHDPRFNDQDYLLAEIRTRFKHFMYACYTLLNMREDWITKVTRNPYK